MSSQACSQEEIDLYERIKNDPEFGRLPLPSHWFKFFNIPPVENPSVREFLESNYTLNCMYGIKKLEPLIIDEPQQGGKLATLIPIKETELTIVQSPVNT